MKQLILIGAFSLFSLMITAQITLHVSSEAKGYGDGTAESPFGTIESALQKTLTYTGHDTVYIQVESGLYCLNKTIKIEQLPSAPVVIQGDTGSKPILSGAITISSWEKTPQGWWKSHIDEVKRYGLHIEQLYMNERRATRARTPDKGWFLVKDVNETVLFKGMGRAPEYAVQRICATPEDLNSLKDLSTEEINSVMAMFYHNWDNTRKYLSLTKPDSGYLFLNGAGLNPWNPIKKGSRFVLENYKRALSVEGEWFLEDSGDLYYIPYKDEKIESAVAYAPVLGTLLSIRGGKNAPLKNLTIRNLSFEHSGYVMPKTGNAAEQAAASVNAAIHLDFANNICFENCEVKHTGNYAIWFNEACVDCSLKHSYLFDLGAGGVKIGTPDLPELPDLTKRITIENNIIQKTGFVFPCGVGVVIFNASDNKIIHNEISDLLYSAVSVGWIWGYSTSYAYNNEIAYNHIHHIGWGELSDMGAVYTLGVSPGTQIHNNVIHHVYSYGYGGWGLYTDEGSSHIVMENNLVYACKSGGFHQHFGSKNIIRNNIFAFNLYNQLQFTRVEDHLSFSFTNNIVLMNQGVLLSGVWDKAKIDMDYNCYWDLRTDSLPTFLTHSFNTWKKLKEHNSIMQNPGFKDPCQLNFHFKNQNIIRKIQFKPFDYEKAGVYGSDAWKRNAKLSKEREELFDRIVKEREASISDI